MKRRNFLKSILGFLALPFVPETKAKTTITDSKLTHGEFGSIGPIRWIRGKDLPPSTKPLFEDLPTPEPVIIKCNKIKDSVKFRKYAPFEASAMPLTDDIGPLSDREFYLGFRWSQSQLKILKEIRENCNCKGCKS